MKALKLKTSRNSVTNNFAVRRGKQELVSMDVYDNGDVVVGYLTTFGHQGCIQPSESKAFSDVHRGLSGGDSAITPEEKEEILSILWHAFGLARTRKLSFLKKKIRALEKRVSKLA